jgi:hypothetical protein
MTATALATRPRDLRFDTLRGLLVLFMAINHIESPLRIVTDQAFGYVSSAEGFVFLSGLVAGWVYGRRMRNKGFAAACGAAARRAGHVYRAHLLTYFAALIWTVLFVFYTHGVPALLPPLFATQPWLAALLGPTLLYQPGLLDILPMYCGFLLLLPWLLRAVERGNGAVVLAFSFALWAFTQAAEGPILAWNGRINLGAFHPLAWQFLFVSGAVLGAHKSAGVPLLLPRAVPLALAFGGAVLIWLWKNAVLGAPLPADQLAALVNKTTLGALRVANFALVAYCVASAAVVFPALFRWRPLALVGQAALPCFAAQTLVAIVVLTYPELFLHPPTGEWIATALMLTTIFATAVVRRWRHDRRIELAIARLLKAPAPRPPGKIAHAR